jgi:hypothetical protein
MKYIRDEPSNDVPVKKSHGPKGCGIYIVTGYY